MHDALIVFAKGPRPGDVKTRLIPFLTPEEAAQLYAAFLRDAVDQYVTLDGVSVRLYLDPPNPAMLSFDLPDTVTVHAQEGEDLGTRMRNAFEETFETGGERVAIIGTDHPTLPLAFVRKAFDALGGQPEICVGPSDDGGYYLLGMNTYVPAPFEDMTYSHDRVFADTVRRLRTVDAGLTVLPRWYDVDTPESLRRLVEDLRTTRHNVPHTRRAIDELNVSVRA